MLYMNISQSFEKETVVLELEYFIFSPKSSIGLCLTNIIISILQQVFEILPLFVSQRSKRVPYSMQKKSYSTLKTYRYFFYYIIILHTWNLSVLNLTIFISYKFGNMEKTIFSTKLEITEICFFGYYIFSKIYFAVYTS